MCDFFFSLGKKKWKTIQKLKQFETGLSFDLRKTESAWLDTAKAGIIPGSHLSKAYFAYFRLCQP